MTHGWNGRDEQRRKAEPGGKLGGKLGGKQKNKLTRKKPYNIIFRCDEVRKCTAKAPVGAFQNKVSIFSVLINTNQLWSVRISGRTSAGTDGKITQKVERRLATMEVL